MAIPYEDSYAGRLRSAVGNHPLILPSARAIVRDAEGRVLFVRRRDNGHWVMPAGSLELGESILQCLQREVKEESGLDVLAATLIAIYSEPRFAFTNAYGGEHQMLALVFRIDEWTGELGTTTDETSDARFFALDALPELPPLYEETLRDLAAYGGMVILK